MRDFFEILRNATRNIGAEYFLLPTQGGASVYRERVYCYELYHQMRLRWPNGCEFGLNGEVDKAGHPYFPDKRHAPKPDFIVHRAGTEGNFAVLEVKSSGASSRGIQKDLETLQNFRNHGYRRAIYLIYGPQAERTASRVATKAAELEQEGPEIWAHPTAGADAYRYH